MVDPPRPVTARSPELRIVRGWGLGLPAARSTRLDVDAAGNLRLRRAGAATQTLGSASSVTRAIWLTPADTRDLLDPWPARRLGGLARAISRGVLRRREANIPGETGDGADILDAASYAGAIVLLHGDGPVLVLRLQPFVPWAGDLSERRETSGAVALARALGLGLEARSADDRLDAAALRRVLVEPEGPSRPKQAAALVLALVAGVLAFLTWPTGGTGTGVALGVASVAAASGPLTMFVQARRRFRDLVAAPPEPSGRAVYRLPRSRVGDSFAQIQLGDRDVVLVDGAGLEIWLPGPALGGVHLVHLGDDDIHLRDERGRLLHAMVVDEVAPEGADRAAFVTFCRNAGLDVRDDLMPIATINQPVRFVHDESTWLARPGSAWDAGGVVEVLDDLLLLGAVILLPGAVAAAVSVPAWGWLVLLGAVTWLVARLWAGRVPRSIRRVVLRAEAAR